MIKNCTSILSIVALSAICLLSGCNTTQSTLGGAALGTAAGAGIGYAIEGGPGGAILGGVLGGLAGGATGNYMSEGN